MKKAIKAAFPVTVPVLLGYLFVGIAFGLLYQNAGYHILWALLMSLTVYAGSMQFVAINFFAPGIGLLEVALMTLLVNIRHVFYGLSFLKRFQGMGQKKPYMIFSLTDETYSLLCSAKPPEGVDPDRFIFAIALLNQCYWVAGSALGSVAGSFISFNTTGIDFAMTALFVVILVEQWLSCPTHLPAMIGAACALLGLFAFGADNLVLPAMIFMVVLLMAFRRPLEPKLSLPEESGQNGGEPL